MLPTGSPALTTTQLSKPETPHNRLRNICPLMWCSTLLDEVGHGSGEPGMIDALIAATDGFAATRGHAAR